jgi:hypothetical protein
MTNFFDWLLTFAQKVFAVPELHAILVACVAGMALTYVLSLKWPAWTPVKAAVQYGRVLIFFVVVLVAVLQIRTPLMFTWAASIGLLLPLFYEWLGRIIYHRWPWLQPKALKP